MGHTDTDHVNRAWALYCEETAGGMDVRDFWYQLSPCVQRSYLEKTRAELPQEVAMCADCDEELPDLPDKLCPGCRAYRDHTT